LTASATLLFQKQQPLRAIPEAMRELLRVLSDPCSLARERFEAVPQVIHLGKRPVLENVGGGGAIGHTGPPTAWAQPARRHDSRSIAGRLRLGCRPMPTITGSHGGGLPNRWPNAKENPVRPRVGMSAVECAGLRDGQYYTSITRPGWLRPGLDEPDHFVWTLTDTAGAPLVTEVRLDDQQLRRVSKLPNGHRELRGKAGEAECGRAVLSQYCLRPNTGSFHWTKYLPSASVMSGQPLGLQRSGQV
jgi:hypothetical protein